MRHHAILAVCLMTLFLGLFFVAEWLQVPILTDPGYLLARAGWVGAFLGFGLLVADVVLPVPSSLIMTAHGLMFGVVLGTLLSTAGAFTAALVAFGIGRRGGSLLAPPAPLPPPPPAPAGGRPPPPGPRRFPPGLRPGPPRRRPLLVHRPP